MKKVLIVVTAFLLVFPNVVFAEKPDPNVPNPPLSVWESNLDSEGWIKVHEQGIASVDIVDDEELDVHVTGGQIDATITGGNVDVSGSTVSVDNFPATQDVNVTGGTVDALIPPASTVALPSFTGLEAGESTTVDFATVFATTIVIWDSSVTGDGDPEFQLDIRSPLNGGGSIFQYSYDETLYTTDMRSFTHPIPVSGVEIWCKNESANCTIGVAVIGY